MDNKIKYCPYCGEKILKEAKKCRHCGEWLTEETKKAAEIKKREQEQASFEKWKEEHSEKQKKNNASDILISILMYAIFWGGIALIVHGTVPSDTRMERAIIKDMQECVRDKTTSYTSLLLGDEAAEIASLFFDSSISDGSIFEQFKKSNSITIESKWLWSVGKIHNRNTVDEGTVVCFGFLGIVIPFVEWEDFILKDEKKTN